MIGVRLNTFNDNSGEPEQDANSALTELDKGLRSGKVGEQCEAIVRFPRLFEKYPFPILINSSFLKLADVFRMGNNFLRLWVLRVCQQSEKHLDKILNVDEFLRRVFSVLHSNDPVARALALRTLGAVAGIIPERQNVHHAIRRGLDSHDNVEVDAAIYATTRFAAHSNAFAVAMCNKLSDMVECESTGAERRAKLVRALRTVHGGAVRAQGVLKLLHSLLERFPSSSSVRAAITALTAIAADTVVHVPDQVELLLSLAVNDARSSVRRAALVGLKKLAQHAALWPNECIQNLVRAATDSQDPDHTMLCLQVMRILVECPAICAAAGSQTSALRQYCAEAAFSVDLRHAATACDVLTLIVVHCYEETLPVDGSELMLALESLVIATGFDNGPSNIRPLRIALRCLVKLCNAEPVLYAPRTANVLGIQLQECDWKQAPPRILALLEALAALGGGTYCPQSIAPAMPALMRTLNAAMQGDPVDSSNDGTALVLLCTVLFQERAGTALTYKINNSWEKKILDTIRGVDGWTRYRVARAALRYGHHSLAAEILKRLSEEAPSESAHRWLTALHRAANADATLLKEGIAGLEAASAGWEVSSGWGGAGCGWGAGCAAWCAGCGGCAPLPAAALAARAAALEALQRAAAAARALCTMPPPAIAHAHAQVRAYTYTLHRCRRRRWRRARPRSRRCSEPPPPRARSAPCRRPPSRTRTRRYAHTLIHYTAAGGGAGGARGRARGAAASRRRRARALHHAAARHRARARAGTRIHLYTTPLPAAALAARAAALEALQRAAAAARALCTMPPPAIAHAHAQAARDPAAKAGACATAVRKAARCMSAVAQRYAALARTAFHADNSTLAHLHIAQHTYAQFAHFLERIPSNQQERPAELVVKEIKPNSLDEMIALAPSAKLAAISAKLFDNPTTGQGITHRHAEAILAAVRACSGGAVWARGVCAGRAGGALCRVSLTPAYRAPPADHAATLPLSHRLALKLEGVVLPAVPLSKRQPHRQVKGVQITVTATPHPRTNEKTVELTNIPPALTAIQTVAPVRDFFAAQQLVSVAAPGLYTVAVECAFVDEKGELWNTGPRTSIVIKAHEDPTAKSIVQTTRSRF